MKDAKQIVEKVLWANGIKVCSSNEGDSFESLLRDISDSIDSLTYISILVQIEESVGACLPDKVLSKNMFAYPDELLHIIKDLLIIDEMDERKLTNEDCSSMY